VRPEARTAFLLRHIGAAMRASPLCNAMGVYTRPNGALAVVLRRYLTARQLADYRAVARRWTYDAERAWEAMAAPTG
jgi:hypothetical protein